MPSPDPEPQPCLTPFAVSPLRRAAPSSPAASETPGPRGAGEREAFPDDQHFHTQLRCQTPFCLGHYFLIKNYASNS